MRLQERLRSDPSYQAYTHVFYNEADQVASCLCILMYLLVLENAEVQLHWNFVIISYLNLNQYTNMRDSLSFLLFSLSICCSAYT